MPRIEVFPKELLFPSMSEEVIVWLKTLDIPYIDKKELLCDWCAYTGFPLTEEFVDKLGPEY